ncbi:MarR family winged helix-turn-helix transcriptional regulator [Kitasatospora aureofaciens]|uniref:MarR family winged helix-turn-helix transcriptional regulator n=1 Tax=Kitasatospora aureofaciens TaxID=1894 RepID=UPI0004C290EB|nr:MarR family transcriptional regulator [Kitasatospora aureofaciens]ARF82965.1 MarR family transcriptional regulator [Kitasatospora aureofaciens]
MNEPRWLDRDEMAAWRGFVVASNLLNRRLERQLKEDSGLSHQQYEILVHLSAAPGDSLRMTELADKLVTSKSGLTYQVTQLERMGLVARRSCPSDVRGVIAELTGQGREMIRRAAPGHVALVRELLIDVLTREQLAVLAESLGAVSARLRQDDVP